MIRESVWIDTILFKFASRRINIVLNHDAIPFLDVKNKPNVHEFLKFLGVVSDTEDDPCTLVSDISNVTVAVTRSPAPEG